MKVIQMLEYSPITGAKYGTVEIPDALTTSQYNAMCTRIQHEQNTRIKRMRDTNIKHK